MSHRARQVETLYIRHNSHFDVNIICVLEYFCHPVNRLREKTDALDDLTVATGGGEEKLEVVLRRTQYRLEVAENANAAMLARSQGQGAALEAGRRRLTKLEQEVRMMKSKNQAELRRKQRKLESQRGKSGDD